MRESNERPVTAALTVAEAEIGGNRLELGLSSLPLSRVHARCQRKRTELIIYHYLNGSTG